MAGADPVAGAEVREAAGPRVRVRDLGRPEEGRAADLLARAFRDNPLNRAVLGRGADRRLRATRHAMHEALRAGWRHGLVLAASGSEGLDLAPWGILIAIPPGGFPLPSPSLLRQLRSVVGQGLGAARRWGEVYAALEAVHPASPHWYLSLLGVDPRCQRAGVGWRLLTSWLASVDREGASSYLETDRSGNVEFYRRAGFAVETELRVYGAPLWCMRRPGVRAG